MFSFLASCFAPPLPVIRYGAFPFKLVYELNGEEKIIEDTLICEYDRWTWDAGRGSHVLWKSRLASGNEYQSNGGFGAVLLDVENQDEKYWYWITPGRGERVVTRIVAFFFPGGTASYMGARGAIDPAEITTFVQAHEQYDNGSWGGITPYGLPDDVVYEKYGIRILSWEIAPPIENTFR